MKTYLEKARFLEGSMKSKVEAAIDFVQRGGKKSIIAILHNLLLAIEGETRTHILTRLTVNYFLLQYLFLLHLRTRTAKL